MPVRSLSLALTLLLSAGTQAQVSVGNTQFLDRAARGEITLGNIRGSFGVLDYDQDGWMDLYIADNAGLPKRLFRNVPSPTAPGGRTFVDVSTASGIGSNADATSRGAGSVVVLDYDNDGFPDIYQPVNRSADGTCGLLFRNNRNGTFTNVTAAAGVLLTGISSLCASSVDFDHDGFADLFIVSPGPAGRTLTLLRNNGNGTFTSRADLLPPVTFQSITYAHTWTDYDHDGWEDALICFNNGVPMTLKNVADGRGGRKFIDATTASGFTFVGPAPMGIATGDIDNDGWLDVAITDASVGTYYSNRNGTLQRTTPYRTFFGWGTSYLDANNDGFLDNYQAGSAGGSNIDFLLTNNGNGTFTDARNALNTTALPSQYSARLDFDNDGREDLVTVNVNRFISIYHNQSARANHWSTVNLRGGPGVNALAIGAIVRLTAGGVTQTREINAGSSYAASEDLRMHFGLGGSTAIDRIEVIWPRQGTLAQRTEVFSGPFAIDSIVTLSSRGSCLADITGPGGNYANGVATLPPDGQLSIEDFIVFISAFTDGAGCPPTPGSSGACNPADITGPGGTYARSTVDVAPDGELTIEDFIVFLSAFTDGTGC